MDDQRDDREGRNIVSGEYPIKRLLVSVALCSAGLAAIGDALSKWRFNDQSVPLFIGGALLFAGFLLPFRRPLLGAVIGIFVVVLFLLWSLAHFKT